MVYIGNYSFLIFNYSSILMTLTSDLKIPVVIDCDPGADDMFALVWALIMHKRGYISIKALTTSGGNVPAQATYENAIRACMMMGVDDIKIAKGKDKEGAENASHIHGNDGVGGLSKLLPVVKEVEKYDSEELLIELIKKYGDELEVLATGPLSNLARIETANPGILKQVKRVICMGGAFFDPGNVSPVAEFNFWYDPESAKVVMNSGADLVIAPLDLTTQLPFTMNELYDFIDHVNHEEHRAFLKGLTEFTISTNMGFRETHHEKGFYVHDASTVGFLIYPHIYSGTYYSVDIETKGELTKGQSVIDSRNYPQPKANAYVLMDMKHSWFLEAITEDFKDFDFEEKK